MHCVFAISSPNKDVSSSDYLKNERFSSLTKKMDSTDDIHLNRNGGSILCKILKLKLCEMLIRSGYRGLCKKKYITAVPATFFIIIRVGGIRDVLSNKEPIQPKRFEHL